MSCQITDRCLDCDDIDVCGERRKWPQCNDWERIKKHWLEEEKKKDASKKLAKE